jgi:hypothetical protein
VRSGQPGRTALQCTVRSNEAAAADEYCDDDDCVDGYKDWYSVCHPCLRALVAAGAVASLGDDTQRKAFALQLLFTVALQYGDSDAPAGTTAAAAAAAAETAATLQQLQRAGLQLDLEQHIFEASILRHNRGWGAAKALLACGASAAQSEDRHWRGSPFYWAARTPDNAALLQLLYDAAPRPRALLETACADIVDRQRCRAQQTSTAALMCRSCCSWGRA